MITAVRIPFPSPLLWTKVLPVATAAISAIGIAINIISKSKYVSTPKAVIIATISVVVSALPWMLWTALKILNSNEEPHKYKDIHGVIYHQSSEIDQLATIQAFHDQGGDIDQKDKDGETALHGAAWTSNIPAMNLLLKIGADINAADKYLRTPLHGASKNQRGTETITRLVEMGANLEAEDINGDTPLDYAAGYGFIDAMQELIKLGAKIRLHTLVSAAVNNRAAVIQLLADQGMNVTTSKTSEDNTALHIAADNGAIEAINKLVELGAPLEASNNHGNKPLHEAASRNHAKAVQVLINHGAFVDSKSGYYGQTPLFTASRRGCIETMEVLLANYANVNYIDEYKDTPAHCAKDAQVLELLHKNGADFSLRDLQGKTVFHRAAGVNDVEKIKFLIKHVDINQPDEDGDTPLHHAARFGKLETVKLLIEAGANKNIGNNLGTTPLTQAMHYHIDCLDEMKALFSA